MKPPRHSPHSPENPYASPQSPPPKQPADPLALPDTLWSTLAAVGICGLPIFNFLYVFLFWWVASLLQGEWLHQGSNDPKSFLGGLPVGLHHTLTLSAFAAGPVAYWLGLPRKRGALYLGAYLLAMGAMIVVFRLDPWQISSWIAD